MKSRCYNFIKYAKQNMEIIFSCLYKIPILFFTTSTYTSEPSRTRNTCSRAQLIQKSVNNIGATAAPIDIVFMIPTKNQLEKKP